MEAREDHLLKLEDKKWIYRGEGDQNLVISLIEERVVLRLTKHPVGSKHSEIDEDYRRNLVLLKFSQDVMKPLIGKVFVPDMELISISTEDALAIAEKLKPFRPAHRKHKDLGQSTCVSLKLPDCSLLPKCVSRDGLVGPTIAVEIKPKAGFLTLADKLPKHLLLKRRVCKYQMMQLRKLHEGKIKRVNSYCPIDLFSGCHRRMHRALRSLLDNPQNNLRIFQDGLLIFGEENNSVAKDILLQLFYRSDQMNRIEDIYDNFEHLVTEALLKEFPDCKTAENIVNGHLPQVCDCSKKVSDTSIHICARCDHLPNNCVLAKILDIQKLDRTDVEGIVEVYQSFQTFSSNFPKDVINNWLYGNFQSDVDWLTLSSCQQKVVIQIREFLLSATAKDCSVMIAFQKLDKSNNIINQCSVIRDMNGQTYAVKVSVIDLDVKPHNRILKYLKEGRELVEIWSNK